MRVAQISHNRERERGHEQHRIDQRQNRDPEGIEQQPANQGATTDREVERGGQRRGGQIAHARRRDAERPAVQQRRESAKCDAPRNEGGDHHPLVPAEERDQHHEHDEGAEHHREGPARVLIAENTGEKQADPARRPVDKEQAGDGIRREAWHRDHPRSDIGTEDVVPKNDEHREDARRNHRRNRAVFVVRQRDLARRQGVTVFDRRQEDNDERHEDQHDDGHRNKGGSPAERVPERRTEGYSDDEGRRAAGVSHTQGAHELFARDEPRGVRSGYCPEQPVREPAEYSGEDKKLVGGSGGGKHVGEGKRAEQTDHEPLAREAAGDNCQRRRGDHDGESEDRHEQSDARLAHLKIAGHVGQKAGWQKLARDGDEDRAGEHQQAEEGKTGLLRHPFKRTRASRLAPHVKAIPLCV